MVTAINSMKSAIQYHEVDIVKIRGAVSKHKLQLKSQAEQIKELQTKKENEDKREQQKRLIMTGLNEEEQKKHFITTVKEKLNIDITETDFSLETKEIRNSAEAKRERPTVNFRVYRKRSDKHQHGTTEKDRYIKLCLHLEETRNLRCQVRVARHRYLPLRRYRCQSTCFIF